MKKAPYPLEVRSGSVIVKVYRVETKGRTRFSVVYHEGPQRKIRQFADAVQARQEAKTIAGQLSQGHGAALELNGADRDSYKHAVALLRGLNVPLHVAIGEYVAAKKYDVPIVEAAKAFAAAHEGKLPTVSVTRVCDEMIEAKRKDGAGKVYLIDLKTRLGQFKRDFKVNIADVQADDISAWHRALDLQPRSRRNHRNAVVALFNFARDEKGYLARERKTAAELSARVKTKNTSIEYFLPAEFARLLSAADADLLPFLVLGGFCGLRTIEIKRLTWEGIRWPDAQIVVSAEASKQGEARRRRVAPLTAPACTWLAGYKSKTGNVLLFSPDNLYKKLEPLCEATGVKWKDNGLRHSFITFRLATLKDPVRVAFEAGNSPQVIRSNYDAVATEAEGKLWFSVLPKTAENVIQISAEA